MEIRKVNASDDFTAIGDIYAKSWKEAYKGIVPQPYLDELSGERWAAILPDSPWDSFVLLDNGKYVGTSAIAPSRDESLPDWGEIISVYLLPEYIGKGFGKLLLDNSLSALKGSGFKQIYLWVLEENVRARRFYERNGFVLTNDRLPLEVSGKELTDIRYAFSVDDE